MTNKALYRKLFDPQAPGFTVVELLVAMGMVSILMAAAFSVYQVQLNSVSVQESRQEAQEYARSILDVMVREIRNAGYNPTGAGTPCGGIFVATTESIRFKMDLNADGDCADADEDVTYTYVSASKEITRSSGGTVQTLTDGNATAFQFTYFPQNCTNNFSSPVGGGTATCPATGGGHAGTLASIKRVSISVTVQSKNPHAGFGGGIISAKMVSNADLRNVGVI
jgi:prepilin-type N-terminal cleavage/methylation domain-containing protein